MKYQCTCGWMFQKITGLKGHMRIVHNTKIFCKREEEKFLIKGFELDQNSQCASCSLCGRFMRKYTLHDHVQNHSKMKYKCSAENCGWMYREDEYQYLKLHSKLKHLVDIRAYPKSAYRIDGETDENSGANSNPVHGIDEDIEWNSEVFRTCPICSRILRGQGSLESHIAVHEHLNEICAENGCGWAYRNFSDLQKHYLFHHKLTVTKDNKDTIYILGNSISDNRKRCPIRRQCPICKRIFIGKFDHDHVRHHDKLKFRCLEPNCGWMFKLFRMLRSHYSSRHKIELSCNAEQIYLISGKIVLKAQSQGYVECPTCSRKMQEKFYPMHQAAHQQKSMYRCPKSGCGWMYENYTTFRSHCVKLHKIRIEFSCRNSFKTKSTKGRPKRFGLYNSAVATFKSTSTKTKQQQARHNNVDLTKNRTETGTELVSRPSVGIKCTQPHPGLEYSSEPFQETLNSEMKEIVSRKRVDNYEEIVGNNIRAKDTVERATDETFEQENIKIKIEKNEQGEENVSEGACVTSVKRLSQQCMPCAQQDLSEIERLMLVDTADSYCNNYAYNENQRKLSGTSTTGFIMNEFTCTPGTIIGVQDSNAVNNCVSPDQCKEVNTQITPPIPNDVSWSTEIMPIVIMPEEDQPSFSQVTTTRTSADVVMHNSGQNPSQRISRLSVQDIDLVSSQNTIGTSLQFPEEGKKSLSQNGHLLPHAYVVCGR